MILTDPSEYEGGTFYIQEEDPSNDKDEEDGEDGKIEEECGYHTIKTPKYATLLFLGVTHNHGVDPFNGTSKALSTEFWFFPDLPFGVNLCAAKSNNIKRYVKQ